MSGWRSTTASPTSKAATSAAITFPDGSLRGGLLGQGSILTLTSYATRTSPVVRGKWVLENLLDCRAAAAAAEHSRAEDRRQRGRQDADDARSHDPAPRQSRRAPVATRAWTPSASRWKISTPSGAGATRIPATPIDTSGVLPGRHQIRRHGRAEESAAGPSRAVRQHRGREAADVRASAATCSITMRPSVRAIVRDAAQE